MKDLSQGDIVVTTDMEKARALSSVFFPDMPTLETEDQRAIDVSWRMHRPPGATVAFGVSPLEVISTIRRQRVGAAPGRDGIPPRVFRKCMMTLLLWLTCVYNACLSSGPYPREWLTARVLALRKPSKADYTMPRSYRPISLLPVMGKIMETIVSRRLSRLLESRRLLSPFQFGFRTGEGGDGGLQPFDS